MKNMAAKFFVDKAKGMALTAIEKQVEKLKKRALALAEQQAGEAQALINKNVEKLAKLEQKLWRDTLHKTTKYDLGGASKYTIFKKVISLEKVEASKVLNELGYLEKMLDKADDPFVEASWLDVAESWMAMAKLIPKMHCSCLLYTSPSPRDGLLSRMPSSA